MSYFAFDHIQRPNLTAAEIISYYADGYVYTRKALGEMDRVRSIRVSLQNFTPSSENRRILGKFNNVLRKDSIPLPYRDDYTWLIHKRGKDFYTTKFGKKTFSANKIKELFTQPSNFTHVLSFGDNNVTFHMLREWFELAHGYCIVCIQETNSEKILHYAYPFYSLDRINTNYGMFMMTKAIEYAKNERFTYVYLGSAHDTASLYKLQFSGLEWWDEETSQWGTDLQRLKERVRATSSTNQAQDTQEPQ